MTIDFNGGLALTEQGETINESRTANEIKQLFLSYQAAGVSFHQALKKEPWGARTFIVSDPDENLILFAGSAAD